MTALLRTLRRYRLHVGLVLARTAGVILFCLAGVTVAGTYLEFLAAWLIGVAAGVALAVVVDQAAVQYGKCLAREELAEHSDRQAAARRRAAAEHNATEHNAPVSPAGRHRNELPGMAGAAATAAMLARLGRGAEAEAGGSRLAGAGDHAGDQEAALVVLRGLMNDTLQPYELVGQQGRGVIQLADEIGRSVPQLDPETITAYVGDHVLVAAGLEPEQAERWPAGLLGGVIRLRLPAGEPPLDAVGLERIDGLEQYAGAELPEMLDTIVKVIRNSDRRDGLALTQINLCLGAKGYRVGPYTLASACRRLVRDGRLDKPFGSVAYRLTTGEIGRQVDDDAERLAEQVSPTDRAPLDVVISVLRGGPAAGMYGPEIAAEVKRRREIPTPRVTVYAALAELRNVGLVVQREPRGPWQLTETA